MRYFRICLMAIIAAGLLSSCFTNKASNCFPGKRCNEHQVYTRCGNYLKYECEDICRLCKAYEPSCYSCWSCISSDPEACLGTPHYGNQCPK